MTDAGIPAQSDEHLLTIGPVGPILLQDHYLIGQMAQFNRERVPERHPLPRVVAVPLAVCLADCAFPRRVDGWPGTTDGRGRAAVLLKAAAEADLLVVGSREHGGSRVRCLAR